MTHVKQQVKVEEQKHIPIEDFLVWASQNGCKIPRDIQEQLQSLSWLIDTRALKCLFGTQLKDFLGLTKEQINLLNDIYLQFAPVVVRSFGDMYESHSSLFFSTGSKNVDQLLQGGIETGHLYEFVGPAASGKTQLCHAIASSCCKQENENQTNNSVLWIDSEHAFHPTITSKKLGIEQRSVEPLFKHILARTLQELLRAFLKMIYFCQGECNLRLIVIDSLIAPIDREYGSDYRERAYAIREILGFLKEVSREFNCAVIITNQVRGAATDEEREEGKKVFPLGGFSFAHATENRFLLEQLEGQRRKIRVLDSSYLPSDETTFCISNEGITNSINKSTGKKVNTSSSKKRKVID